MGSRFTDIVQHSFCGVREMPVPRRHLMFFDCILEVFKRGVLGGLRGDDEGKDVLCEAQARVFGILRI